MRSYAGINVGIKVLPNATAAWTQIGKKIRASWAQDPQPAVHVLKTDDGSPSLEHHFNGVRSPLKSGAEGKQRAPNIIFFLTDDQDQLLGGSFPHAAPHGASPLPQASRLLAARGSTATRTTRRARRGTSISRSPSSSSCSIRIPGR